MLPRHRMPGLTPDQIYTYPAKRWRKKRRSYLTTYNQSPKKKEPSGTEGDATESQNSNSGPGQGSEAITVGSVTHNPPANNEDSKESTPAVVVSSKDESSKVNKRISFCPLAVQISL